MRPLAILFAFGLFAAPFASSAAIDGKADLLCSVVAAHHCSLGEACEPGLAGGLNLPDFIRVQPGKKRAVGIQAGEERPGVDIGSITRAAGRTILHGNQEGRGWSMVVDHDTGHMTLSVSGEEIGFVVFGACTPD